MGEAPKLGPAPDSHLWGLSRSPFDPWARKGEIEFNTEDLEHIVTVWKERSISRWIKCNSVVGALPQLTAQLHDLLETFVAGGKPPCGYGRHDRVWGKVGWQRCGG
ncbi:hypothetical protein GB937_006027 [Aspergillus fischeri]|nr:hypothetical protein GB937_006027 [Aspergillus fischeri]